MKKLLLLVALFSTPASASAPIDCRAVKDIRKFAEGAICLAVYENPMTHEIAPGKWGFQLIKRGPGRKDQNGKDQPGKEVWKDLATGLLWSDVTDFELLYESADPTLESPDADTFCSNSLSGEIRGDLPGFVFDLPTVEDYQTGDRHGFKDVVPGIYSVFAWARKSDAGELLAFGSSAGFVSRVTDPGQTNAVRCVARGAHP